MSISPFYYFKKPCQIPLLITKLWITNDYHPPQAKNATTDVFCLFFVNFYSFVAITEIFISPFFKVLSFTAPKIIWALGSTFFVIIFAAS